MITITEADVEQAALDWLSTLGWQVTHDPDIASDTERGDFGTRCCLDWLVSGEVDVWESVS